MGGIVISALARVPPKHNVLRRALPSKPRSISRYVVHMTGSSIVAKAIAAGRAPLEQCVRYYASNACSAHYVIGYDGAIVALTDERIRYGHVGVYEVERQAYLLGAWQRSAIVHAPDGELGPIAPAAIEQWQRAWPRYKSPQHLFAPTSINDCSVASEMPPAGYYDGGIWRPLPGVELWEGTRHTLDQHLAVAELTLDIATRYAWPDGWVRDARGGPRSPWVLGHEDVDLYGRSDAKGGWDPGALRARPYWSWPTVWRAIELLRARHTRAEVRAQLAADA